MTASERSSGCPRVAPLVGLGKPPTQAEQHRAVSRQDREQHPPARHRDQRPADDRGGCRRDAEDEAHQRNDARRAVPGKPVDHHHPRERNAAAGADPLHQPPADQRRHRTGRRACDRSDHVKREATDEDRATAEAIGQWSTDQLCDGETEQVNGDRRPNRLFARMKRGDERRHRRRVKAHRKRPDRDQQRADDRHSERRQLCGRDGDRGHGVPTGFCCTARSRRSKVRAARRGRSQASKLTCHSPLHCEVTTRPRSADGNIVRSAYDLVGIFAAHNCSDPHRPELASCYGCLKRVTRPAEPFT